MECLRSEQERLKRNGEVELEQLNAVIDKLQQELANIERKLPPQEEEEEEVVEEEENQARTGGGGGGGGDDDDELGRTRRRLDEATGELGALRLKHGELFETYRRLKETSAALAQTEEQVRAAAEEETETEEERSEARREDALRETASLVVMQAQVQALEQSATSRVDELRSRVQELERSGQEKEAELARGRQLAETLRGKVVYLEDRLRETGAAGATTALGVGQEEPRGQTDPRRTQEEEVVEEESQPLGARSDAPLTHALPDFGLPQLDSSSSSSSSFGRAGGDRGPAGGSGRRSGQLTEKLRELEVGLCGMQKDQELQKQLLSSSEEEVLEYERRLAVLMDLLNQMRSKAGAPHKTWKPTSEVRNSLINGEAVCVRKPVSKKFRMFQSWEVFAVERICLWSRLSSTKGRKIHTPVCDALIVLIRFSFPSAISCGRPT